MTRKLWPFYIATLIGAVFLGLYRPLIAGEIDGLWEFVAVVFYGYILVPWGLFLLLRGLYLLASRQWLLPLKPWFLTWAFCLFTVFVFVVSNGLGRDWQIHRARNFVEAVSPTLDKIKVKTGDYPANLPDNWQQTMPRILSYVPQGKSYSFSYTDGMMRGAEYYSETRSWQPWS